MSEAEAEAEADTGVEQFKEYPAIHGVLIVDSRGIATTNAIGVTVNTAPSAYRGRSTLACVTQTINGLGLVAVTMEQLDSLIESLVNARRDAQLASARRGSPMMLTGTQLVELVEVADCYPEMDNGTERLAGAYRLLLTAHRDTLRELAIATTLLNQYRRDYGTALARAEALAAEFAKLADLAKRLEAR